MRATWWCISDTAGSVSQSVRSDKGAVNTDLWLLLSIDMLRKKFHLKIRWKSKLLLFWTGYIQQHELDSRIHKSLDQLKSLCGSVREMKKVTWLGAVSWCVECLISDFPYVEIRLYDSVRNTGLKHQIIYAATLSRNMERETIFQKRTALWILIQIHYLQAHQNMRAKKKNKFIRRFHMLLQYKCRCPCRLVPTCASRVFSGKILSSSNTDCCNKLVCVWISL